MPTARIDKVAFVLENAQLVYMVFYFKLEVAENILLRVFCWAWFVVYADAIDWAWG